MIIVLSETFPVLTDVLKVVEFYSDPQLMGNTGIKGHHQVSHGSSQWHMYYVPAPNVFVISNVMRY